MTIDNEQTDHKLVSLQQRVALFTIELELLKSQSINIQNRYSLIDSTLLPKAREELSNYEKEIIPDKSL